jgi:hypothetical protein
MPNEITVQIGKCFDVSQYAHGGTGYTWLLTGLPKGIALFDVSSGAVGKTGEFVAGGPVRQVFTFLGTGVGKGVLSFALLRPWLPGEPADTRTYTVTVVADAEAEMRGAAGQESFPPMVAAVSSGEHKGKTVIESKANCVLKYGILPHDSNCNVRYGFPITNLYNVNIPNASVLAKPPHDSK